MPEMTGSVHGSRAVLALVLALVLAPVSALVSALVSAPVSALVSALVLAPVLAQFAPVFTRRRWPGERGWGGNHGGAVTLEC